MKNQQVQLQVLKKDVPNNYKYILHVLEEGKEVPGLLGLPHTRRDRHRGGRGTVATHWWVLVDVTRVVTEKDDHLARSSIAHFGNPSLMEVPCSDAVL